MKNKHMITFLLILALIISLGLNVATFILIQINLNKIRTYEQWIIDFKQNVSNTLEQMRKLDEDATFKSSFESTGMGVFESDDQVGHVFKELLELVKELDAKVQ
jgi:hypothetical protein